MSDPLREALEALRKQRSELEELASTIRIRPRLVRVEHFPPRRARLMSSDEPPVALPPVLSPHEVYEEWLKGGVVWLRGRGRREMSAVVAALSDPLIGPKLSLDELFAAALYPLLRPRQRWAAISTLFFQNYKPLPTPVQLLQRLRTEDPTRAPVWAADLARPQQFLSMLSSAIATDGWPSVREGWQIPGCASTSNWTFHVVSNSKPTTFEEHKRLLQFVDGGEDRTASATIQDAHIHVIQAMVAYGQSHGPKRLEIASLLRRRVGDVFGVLAQGAWRMLEAERRIVRSWVATEILDILFKHIVPESYGAHQTEARRLFWSGYTHCIDRLWLLVNASMRQRLARTEIRDLLERVGDVIEVRELRGQQEQSVVWMHLRSESGEVVTAIEGNANISFRMRAGAFEPPKGGYVEYSAHVVNGALAEERGAYVRAHYSDWQRRVRHELSFHGIYSAS